MRINIYSEEMTSDWEWCEKSDVLGSDGVSHTFHGLRIYLKSPPELHCNELDDDRSAITFWNEDKQALMNMLRNLS